MAGVRSNQLTGYGLVVGLDGTGDQTTAAPFTTQSLISMLQQLGVTIPPGTQLQLRNVAAVMVTAELPAFAAPGQTVDVNVSSIGNAKSLRGGTLVTTPLKGADGQIYALAQGNLVIGGAGAAANGSKVVINQLSSGRVPAGATVERAVPNTALQGDSLQLAMHATDYQTATRGGPGHQPGQGAGHGHGPRRPHGAREHAGRARPARRLPGRHREPAGAAGQAGGEGDPERAHRLGGAERIGDAGRLRGGARQPVGDDLDHADGQPAGAARQRPHRRSPSSPTSRSPPAARPCWRCRPACA